MKSPVSFWMKLANQFRQNLAVFEKKITNIFEMGLVVSFFYRTIRWMETL